MWKKCVLLIIDGLGDRPNPELRGCTPLEAAATPLLDKLAVSGKYGLLDPLAPGVVPATHSGTGVLFGLLPEEVGRLQRGPVEAWGAGRFLKNGEVALRANFATLESRAGDLLVTDRRAGRIMHGTGELAAALTGMDLGDGVRGEFLSTDQHRGVLVLSGPGLDSAVSDTDPGDGHVPGPLRPARALHDRAAFTAERLNRFIAEAHRRLQDHPVNRARRRQGLPAASGVITRGAGTRVEMGNLLRTEGIRAAVVAGCNTILGLADYSGMDLVTSKNFTAGLDTDVEGKVAAAVAALEAHDLVYLHFKAPDLCAHDRQAGRKRDFLERIDAALAPLAGTGAVFALAADHSTDSNTGAHTADPIPALLHAAGAPAPAAVNFGETACRNGNMPRQTSHEFLQHVIRVMADTGEVIPPAGTPHRR